MAEERDSVDVVRISSLREYLSVDEKLRTTPSPFCEFRVYQFRKSMPQGVYLHIVRNMLKVELERLEKLFQSIDLVKNKLPMQTGKSYVIWSDKEEENLISARKIMAGKGAKIFIDGMEIEPVSQDEVLQFFARFQRRVKLGFIYRYVCFYDTSGNVRAEYDEEKIQSIEAEVGAEAFFE